MTGSAWKCTSCVLDVVCGALYLRGGVQGRGVVRDREVSTEVCIQAVRKFSKNFGKLMVFQDEGDVGGAFALLLLCCCFGVTPIGAL